MTLIRYAQDHNLVSFNTNNQHRLCPFDDEPKTSRQDTIQSIVPNFPLTPWAILFFLRGPQSRALPALSASFLTTARTQQNRLNLPVDYYGDILNTHNHIVLLVLRSPSVATWLDSLTAELAPLLSPLDNHATAGR